jgi:outer membrane protein OmpA-like peptidoglycan-associated protein
MKTKIRVRGKSQGRTALGIVNAYLKLHPDSTLSELRQAFPNSLNPKSFTDHLIVPEKETQGQEKHFFEREDELLVLKNGEKFALVELWKKENFDAICEHAKQYGIEVAKIEGTNPFEKGSYELEYLDEIVPPAGIATIPEPGSDGRKKRKFNWWWILLLILLLLILFFCLKKCCSCCSDKCSNPDSAPVENVAPVTPATGTPENVREESAPLVSETGDSIAFTLPDGKEWKIDKNSPEYKLFSFLNSDDAKVDDSDKTKGWITLDKLRFEAGKTKFAPESDKQLENVAMIMKFFPNSHIKMGGYTDNAGTDAVNMRLSSERAKIAAEKLIAFGIDANRVTHEGYASQYPVCPENNTVQCRAANRRIDVRVTQK